MWLTKEREKNLGWKSYKESKVGERYRLLLSSAGRSGRINSAPRPWAMLGLLVDHEQVPATAKATWFGNSRDLFVVSFQIGLRGVVRESSFGVIKLPDTVFDNRSGFFSNTLLKGWESNKIVE